ncbi:MAG: hypothetical protein LBQ38_00115, partial [Spirochaetaceae bacterium]|nr:hypothetical protein [Spirochaetaceae bacterium]
MAQRTDLYSILMNYADKHHSPYIHIDTFIEFLEKYAGRHAEEWPEWKKWTIDTNVKFWGELSHLTEEGKCVLLDGDQEGQIYLAEFYAEMVRQTYNSPDEAASMPFPNEHSLQITIPADQVR